MTDGKMKCGWCFKKLDPHATDGRCTECRELHSSGAFPVGHYFVDTRKNEHIRPPEGGMDYSHFILALNALDKRMSDLEDAAPENQKYSGNVTLAIGCMLGFGIVLAVWLGLQLR